MDHFYDLRTKVCIHGRKKTTRLQAMLDERECKFLSTLVTRKRVREPMLFLSRKSLESKRPRSRLFLHLLKQSRYDRIDSIPLVLMLTRRRPFRPIRRTVCDSV